MIVKIKGIKEVDWWVFDKVKKAHYGVNNYHEVMNDDCDLKLINDDEVKARGDKVLFLVMRLENDNEYSVSFSTKAYLCDDTGKTIEKII